MFYGVESIQSILLYRFAGFYYRANQPLDVFGQDFTVYRCLRIVKVTDYSYYYYIFAGSAECITILYDTSLICNAVFKKNDFNTRL